MSKIKYRDGYKYQLVETYTHNTEIQGLYVSTKFISLTPTGKLIIHEGYAYDGPSGPTFDTKDSMRGALVHDALYQLMRENLIPRTWKPYADKLLHDICVEDGMLHIRADIWEKAVEIFGFEGLKQDEVHEAP